MTDTVITIMLWAAFLAALVFSLYLQVKSAHNQGWLKFFARQAPRWVAIIILLGLLYAYYVSDYNQYKDAVPDCATLTWEECSREEFCTAKMSQSSEQLEYESCEVIPKYQQGVWQGFWSHFKDVSRR